MKQKNKEILGIVNKLRKLNVPEHRLKPIVVYVAHDEAIENAELTEADEQTWLRR